MTEQQNKTNHGKTGCSRLCVFGGLVLAFFAICTAMWLVHIHEMGVKCQGTTFDARCREFDTGKDLQLGKKYQVSIETDGAWFDRCDEATPEGFGVKEYPTEWPKRCDPKDYGYAKAECGTGTECKEKWCKKKWCKEECKEECANSKEKRMLYKRKDIEEKWRFKLLGWLSRSPEDRLFQLLGQVGDGPILHFDWKLTPGKEKSEQIVPPTVWTAPIPPNQDGRLKLFVNDVDLIFLPWGRWYPYGNNQGTGTVQVDVVEHNETGE